MWYGLCTQAAKDEAEDFAYDNYAARLQGSLDEATIRQLHREKRAFLKEKAIYDEEVRKKPLWRSQ